MVVCKAIFQSEGAPDYAEMGLNIEPDIDWTPFAFDPSQIESFNESSHENCTSLNFKSGYSITTDMQFNEVIELCRASAQHQSK